MDGARRHRRALSSFADVSPLPCFPLPPLGLTAIARRPTFAPSTFWMEIVSEPLAVVKGTLDVLVLKALSWGPMHGFEVAAWLEGRSRGALALDDSGLYQALYRLEGRALVAAEWGVTENNRRARYYRLTEAGRLHLTRETGTWVRYADVVTAILTTPHAAT